MEPQATLLVTTGGRKTCWAVDPRVHWLHQKASRTRSRSRNGTRNTLSSWFQLVFTTFQPAQFWSLLVLTHFCKFFWSMLVSDVAITLLVYLYWFLMVFELVSGLGICWFSLIFTGFWPALYRPSFLSWFLLVFEALLTVFYCSGLLLSPNWSLLVVYCSRWSLLVQVQTL